eukprot:4963842-Amphidinium_carterae.1
MEPTGHGKINRAVHIVVVPKREDLPCETSRVEPSVNPQSLTLHQSYQDVIHNRTDTLRMA